MAGKGDAGNGMREGALEGLQLRDPHIQRIALYSKEVVGYFLKQDGPTPGWVKANIEGPLFVVSRRTAPRWQLIVKNQVSAECMVDSLHPDWELDCQKNYVFYKIEDASQKIRGLWFHDDAERQRVEQQLTQILNEMRKAAEPGPLAPSYNEPDDSAVDMAAMAANAVNQQGSVTVTKESLRMALHGLADDQTFLNAVMKKLGEKQ